MKLHLPKQLFTALLAAIACLSKVEAEGIIYTVTAQSGTDTEMAYATYTETIKNEDGTYTLTSTTQSGWNSGNGPAATVVSGNNIIRFADGTGISVSNKALTYTFNNWEVGGLIVDASGYSVAAGNDGVRPFDMNAGSYDINYDFSISTSNSDDQDLNFSGNQTWDVAADAEMTFISHANKAIVIGGDYDSSNATANVTFGGAGAVSFDSLLQINSGSELSLNTAATANKNITNNGALTVNSGATFTANGTFTNAAGATTTVDGTLAIAGAITNNGTLNLNGKLAADSLDRFRIAQTAIGVNTGHGFRDEISYLAVTGSGTVNVADDAKIHIGGVETGVAIGGNGTSNAWFNVAADANTYYVFENAATAAITTAVTESGKTLNAIHVDSSAVLQHDSGGFENVSLSGGGTYEANRAALNGLSVSDDWSGTVVLTGGDRSTGIGKYLIKDTVYKEGKSKVGLRDFTTHAMDAAIGVSLVLYTGSGYALKLDNGSSYGFTSTFNGSIGGEGSIGYTFTGGYSDMTATHVFAGNTADWSGKFINDSVSGMPNVTVKFTSGGNVFSSTNRTGGVEDKHAESRTDVTIESTSNTNFYGSLTNIRQLNVKGNATLYNPADIRNGIVIDSGKTLTLDNGDATFAAAITGSGNLTKAGSGTLTLSGTVGAENSRLGTVSVTAGELKLTGTGYVTTLAISGDADVRVDVGGNLNVTTFNASTTNANANRNVYIENGAAVTASNFNVDWNMGTVKVDGLLDATTELYLGTGNDDNTEKLLSGAGEISATKLRAGNYGSYGVNVATLSIGASGLVVENEAVLNLASTTTTVSGTTTVNSGNELNFVAGSATLSGGISAAGTVGLSGGSLILGSGENVSNTIAQFNYSGGTLAHSGLTVTNASFSGSTLDNSANTNGTLTLNGSLNLTGNLALLTPDGSTTYSGSDVEGNGFAMTTYKVITGGSLEYGDSFEIQLNGTKLEFDDTLENYATKGDSALSIVLGGNVGTYYANSSETVSYDKASGYYVARDATLEFSGEQAQNAELSKSVAGTGTVKVTFNTSNHNESVQFGDAFNGVLDVSGYMHLANFRLGKDATIKLTSGQVWNKNSTTSAYKILLAGAAEDSFSFIGSELTLTGAVTGSYLTTSASMNLQNAANNITQVKVTNGTTNLNAGTYGTVKATGGTTNIVGAEVTDLNVSGGTTNISGGSVSTANISGGTLNLAGGSLTSTLNYTNSGTVNFKLAAGRPTTSYTVTEIKSSSADNYTRNLTVDSGVILTIDSLTNSWGMGAITVNGELIVNVELKFATGGNNSTGTNILTGSGIVSTETLVIGNVGKYNFSGITLKIGAGGITKTDNYNEGSVSLNLGAMTIEATADWSNTAVNKIQLVGAEGTPTVFDSAGYTITMSAGGISGTGGLEKTGVGNLILSGANTYSGGTTITGGMLTVNNAAALGTGSVSVSEGATLKLAVTGVDSLLSSATGAGTVEVAADQTLTGSTSMSHIKVSNGALLTIGNGGGNAVNISSLDSVILNGGSVKWNAMGTTLQKLDVQADSDWTVFDMGSGGTWNENKLVIDTVSVKAGATLTVNKADNASWKQALNIGVLTGEGAVSINGPGETGDGEQYTSSLQIDSLKDFSGSLSITSREGNNAKNPDYDAYNVVINTGVAGATLNNLEFDGFGQADETSSATLNVQGDTSIGTLSAQGATVNLSADTTLSLGQTGEGAQETTHSVGMLSAADGTVNLVAGSTLTLAGGTSETQKVHIIGTVTSDEGTGISLGDYATLTLSNTLDSRYANSGNNDSDSSLNLAITGGEGSRLNLKLTTNTEWEYNNTVSLSPLTEGGKTVDDVYVMEGYLAADVFGGTAKTDMNGAVLHLKNGTSLIIRGKQNPALDLNSGGVQVHGSVDLFLYGTAKANTHSLVDSFSGDTLNITNGGGADSAGGIELTGNLSLSKLSNQAKAEVVLSGEKINLGTLEVNSSTGAQTKVTSNASMDKLEVKMGSLLVGGESNTITAGKATISRQGASLSNVTVDGSKISATSTTDGAKGTISNANVAIGQLAEGTSFSITDMALSNAVITAAEATPVVLQNVTAENTQLAAGNFTLHATPAVGTYDPETATGTLSYSNGLGVQTGASLTLNLDVISAVSPEQHGVYDITVTLSGFGSEFAIDSLEAIRGMVDFDPGSWLAQALVSQKAEYSVVTEQTPASPGEGGVPTVSYAAGTGSNVGTLTITITGLNVPEPTSATLGLAALMMLCARRRRRA